MTEIVRSATRMDAVQAPIIPVIGDIIRQVPGTISLGQGVVHYGPPQEAVDAARAAASDRSSHEYHSGDGLPELVARIDKKLRDENGIETARGSRVMVTAGSNMAFMHAVLAITEPGDEIILPLPFYFNHEMAVQMAGCRPVLVPTDARGQLHVDALRAAATARTRAVVTISPNNPTGAMLTESALREVNGFCGDRGMYHVSDETYEYFTYGSNRHFSPGAFAGAAPHTISLFSLSKAYGFAGWRIGYAAYPDDLAPAMAKIQDTILICAPAVSQRAAVAALAVGRSYCAAYLNELAEVRRLVLDALGAMAPLCDAPAADGAFYCFVRLNTTMDAMTVAERLIREHQVAVVPGPAFGVSEGCCFRVAYGALQKASVAEGIGRLVTGLRAICG
jgi:aspartate/methionine/tyrosine aminotransferase